MNKNGSLGNRISWQDLVMVYVYNLAFAFQGSSLYHRSVVITVITMNITAGYAKERLKKFSLSISLYSRRGAPLSSKKLSCPG